MASSGKESVFGGQSVYLDCEWASSHISGKAKNWDLLTPDDLDTQSIGLHLLIQARPLH